MINLLEMVGLGVVFRDSNGEALIIFEKNHPFYLKLFLRSLKLAFTPD